MSETDDRYREHDAKGKGHVQGLYGEPRSINPYKPGTGTYLAWLDGWKCGKVRHMRMRHRRVHAI